MISVGLDIGRLGLMLVQGQPKTAAEYIQATSRVGRAPERPGLVVTVLNLHKPRDRTHYEQFGQFHRSFYRAVEATSVTPWAARALDRALAAIVVAIARHIDPSLAPERAVTELRDRPDTCARVRDAILTRAPDELIAGGRAALGAAIDGLLQDWIATAEVQTATGNPFYYGRRARRLLHVPLDPALPNSVSRTSALHRRPLDARRRAERSAQIARSLQQPDRWGRGPVRRGARRAICNGSVTLSAVSARGRCSICRPAQCSSAASSGGKCARVPSRLSEEPRLAKMIERMLLATGRIEEGRSLSLRTPPLAADIFNKEPPGVAVTVFPTWFVCAADRTEVGGEEVRRRRLVRWSDLDPAGPPPLRARRRQKGRSDADPVCCWL